MSILTKATGALLIIFFGTIAGIASAADDPMDIRMLISHEFDRPGAAVVSDPIVIVQEFAVADWVQGEKGGRALLHKESGQWAIMLCSGDGIRNANKMVEAGVPRPIASDLASKLFHVESGLPTVKVKMFGLFGSKQRTHNEHAEHH